MSGSPLQTEFEFTLPKGYVDDEGTVHTTGRMRLATAADEIKPLNDPRVQENSSYLTIVLLSRVVVSLGTIDDVTPEVIESLFVSDLEYLQELYSRVNTGDPDIMAAVDTVDTEFNSERADNSGPTKPANDSDSQENSDENGTDRRDIDGLEVGSGN